MIRRETNIPKTNKQIQKLVCKLLLVKGQEWERRCPKQPITLLKSSLFVTAL